ncbi:imidazole glycerol phosphate synthase subunit HisH [Lactiplantibacillus paraplantarum]|uniref:imidazole glycerol phosphate synthase subunit HisH n=1 Tax=Lactiplantibacillus paraplantarum TaxID=60520 RepID=UPI000513CA7A|nr:imidazole glycerol phosphate synthase subunit HisH [Lactiplantibacillus paraplantarum]OAX76515.1 imidazole glycerol phosphate synthase, glutamine amidotransferase subunit [Lactiplantibacillus plantarum]ALO04818.1 imidazole glycerol phosphate synthase subunit HisH [Lactiplantibacillus paraplantarum]KGE74228.1 imidazole glycerol phosphate synthase [Lactiplantibacillus paraplantarum]MCW1910916.1 imidazole glycerol phosphate synthase subunit HisH [Lactiplantibacillus paraplantarum]RDG10766.1 im
MFAIVDYDTGNTRNLKKAFDYLQVPTVLTADPQQLAVADAIILPGVGAFAAAMAALKERRLVSVLQTLAQNGKPVLGICLGMQLLFESSSEYGEHSGLGLLSGHVTALPTDLNVKVPQMGWNQNELQRSDGPFASIDAAYTYFVHSYYAVCPVAEIVATVQHGVQVPSIVQRQNVIGMQFHPEKSGQVGLKQLAAFKEMVSANDFSSN